MQIVVDLKPVSVWLQQELQHIAPGFTATHQQRTVLTQILAQGASYFAKATASGDLREYDEFILNIQHALMNDLGVRDQRNAADLMCNVERKLVGCILYSQELTSYFCGEFDVNLMGWYGNPDDLKALLEFTRCNVFIQA